MVLRNFNVGDRYGVPGIPESFFKSERRYGVPGINVGDRYGVPGIRNPGT